MWPVWVRGWDGLVGISLHHHNVPKEFKEAVVYGRQPLHNQGLISSIQRPHCTVIDVAVAQVPQTVQTRSTVGVCPSQGEGVTGSGTSAPEHLTGGGVRGLPQVPLMPGTNQRTTRHQVPHEREGAIATGATAQLTGVVLVGRGREYQVARCP